MNKNYFLTIAFIAFFAISSKAADTTPPVITLKGGNTQNVQITSTWSLNEPLSITDDQTPSQDIVTSFTWGSNGMVNSLIRGTYSLVIKATDLAGNFSEETIVFKVDDFIPPVITLNTDNTICTEFREPYIPVKPTVTDNFYNLNQISFVLKSDVNTNVKGMYTDEYEAIDGSGNIATKIRIVIVKENCATVGVESPIEIVLNLFPNPANEFIEIGGITFSENVTVSLVSVDGKSMEGLKFQNNILDISNIQSGFYTLTIVDGNRIYNAKVNIVH